MGNTLYVDSDSLTGVGNRVIDIAASVRDTYTKLQATINAVTSKESWSGEASETFLNKFENIKPSFEQHLRELEELGPTIVDVAGGYSQAEQDNIGNMKGGEQ